MKTVYRIENAEGKGPYNTTWFAIDDQQKTVNCGKLMLDHADAEHPSPFNDDNLTYSIYEEFRKYVCGFDSMEKLNNWFSNYWQRTLASINYTIHTYEVPDENIVYGEYQIMFIKP
jgi:hypothetical protein